MLAKWNGRTNGFWIDVHGHLAHIGLELEMSPGVTQSTVCTGVRAIVRTLHTGVPTVFGTGRLCTPVAVEVVSSDGRTWRGKLCKAGSTLTWKCRTHGIGGQSWHRPDSAPPPIDGSAQPRIHAGSTSGTPAANEIECARNIATETISDADAAALEEYLLAVLAFGFGGFVSGFVLTVSSEESLDRRVYPIKMNFPSPAHWRYGHQVLLSLSILLYGVANALFQSTSGGNRNFARSPNVVIDLPQLLCCLGF